MLKEIFLISTLVFFFVSIASAFALISVSPDCIVGKCTISVSDCSSGTISVYEKTCSNLPVEELLFDNSKRQWVPETPGTYYLKAFCDDIKTKSDCKSATVLSKLPTDTSSDPGPTPNTTLPTTSKDGGDSSLTIFIILIIILIVIVVLYFLFFKKSKSASAKTTYEQLYSKWGRR